MNLTLVNLQSDEQIKLCFDKPFIIGRGSILGCTDKRVSRNHGRIMCTIDGRLQLVALHTNPCFFMRSGVPPIIQLNKGEVETLNEGDCLGLLPNAFWFQIILNKEIKTTDSIKLNNENCNVLNKYSDINNLIIKEEVEDNFNSEKNLECFEDEISCCLSKGKPISSTDTQIISNEVVSAELEKTKKLPLYMYEIDDPKYPNKGFFSKKTETKLKKSNDQNSPSTSKILEANSSSQPLKEFPKNKKLSEGEKPKDGYEQYVETESTAPQRLICQYEGYCYRQHPQHKLDFSHPGDADFIPYEKRPLCNYGAACYRKNKKHLVEFRHPPPDKNLKKTRPSNSSLASPSPTKCRCATSKRLNSDCEENEYDSEEPFINDASSDEYLPSDSFSEEMDSSA